ncbi:MAG: hypothetical protein V1761_00170 [bacterium]
MPIFESIQRAENAAEQMRTEANETAKKLLDATRKEIDAIVKQRTDDTDAQILAIAAESDKRAVEEHALIIAAGAAADRQDELTAVKHKGKALRAIMKKVTGA